MRTHGTPVLLFSPDKALLKRLVDAAHAHPTLSPSWCETADEAKLKLSLRPKALAIDLCDMNAWRLVNDNLSQRRVVVVCDDARCVARVAQLLLKGVAGVFSRDDTAEDVIAALDAATQSGAVGPSWQKLLAEYEALALQNAGAWRFIAGLRRAAFAGLCLRAADVSARDAEEFGLNKDAYYYAIRTLEDALATAPEIDPDELESLAGRLGFLSLLSALPNEQPDPDIEALARLWRLKRLGR